MKPDLLSNLLGEWKDLYGLIILHIQCRHLIPALNESGHDGQPQAQMPTSCLGMYACMTSLLNVALNRKQRGLMVCLA